MQFSPFPIQPWSKAIIISYLEASLGLTLISYSNHYCPKSDLCKDNIVCTVSSPVVSHSSKILILHWNRNYPSQNIVETQKELFYI